MELFDFTSFSAWTFLNFLARCAPINYFCPIDTSHHGLRESFDEQMYALNETLDAQTHMVHSHSEGISDLKETSGKLWNKIDEDISSHNDRLTLLEDALTGKNEDSNEKFDQLQCLINHHGESVSQLSNQVQQLTGEFRGVLQTVDDQVY